MAEELGVETISYGAFVEFVLKTGLQRPSYVRRLKYGGATDGRRDFWGELRQGLVEAHPHGDHDLKALEARIDEGRNVRKWTRYVPLIESYRHMRAKIGGIYEPPLSREWPHDGNLPRVVVAPEVGWRIRQRSHAVALTFAQRPLSVARRQLTLTLMELAFRADGPAELQYAVLDLPRRTFDVAPHPVGDLERLLEAEWMALAALWRIL